MAYKLSKVWLSLNFNLRQYWTAYHSPNSVNFYMLSQQEDLSLTSLHPQTSPLPIIHQSKIYLQACSDIKASEIFLTPDCLIHNPNHEFAHRRKCSTYTQ